MYLGFSYIHSKVVVVNLNWRGVNCWWNFDNIFMIFARYQCHRFWSRWMWHLKSGTESELPRSQLSGGNMNCARIRCRGGQYFPCNLCGNKYGTVVPSAPCQCHFNWSRWRWHSRVVVLNLNWGGVNCCLAIWIVQEYDAEVANIQMGPLLMLIH